MCCWSTAPLREMVKKERFWNDIDRTLDSIRNEYRLCILGDLNGWIGDRKRVGITSAFGVPGENDNGKRVVKFCEERGMCGPILSTEVCISTEEWQGVKKV